MIQKQEPKQNKSIFIIEGFLHYILSLFSAFGGILLFIGSCILGGISNSAIVFIILGLISIFFMCLGFGSLVKFFNWR